MSEQLYRLVISETQRKEIINSIKPDIEMWEDALRCTKGPYSSHPEDRKTAKRVLPILKGIVDNLENDVEEIQR